MSTTMQSPGVNVSANTNKAAYIKTKTNSIVKFLKNAEADRFGITPLLLIIIACIGGFAAASGITDNWIKLAAVVFPATISLAMILAVAPMRIIFISAAITIMTDILVLLF